MDKKLSLNDFSFFEKSACGGYSFAANNPNKRIVVLTKSYISVSKKASDFLHLKKDSKIILALKDASVYMVVLPMDSKIKGFEKLKGKTFSTEFTYGAFSTPIKIKEEIYPAVYTLLDPIYISGMDFYKLDFFKELR